MRNRSKKFPYEAQLPKNNSSGFPSVLLHPICLKYLWHHVRLLLIQPACMYCVAKLKHTNRCSVNLLLLIISSYLNPISLNTPLCDVLPLKKTPSEVVTEDAVTTENNGSSVKNLINKTFDSDVLLSCHTTDKLHGLKLSALKWIHGCLYLP